jgi:hypothetical protein
MALSFPSSPTPNQIYAVGDQSWKTGKVYNIVMTEREV